MTMTIEEIILSERHRNKRKRKYELLVVFSFFRKQKKGNYCLCKGRVKRKAFRYR